LNKKGGWLAVLLVLLLASDDIIGGPPLARPQAVLAVHAAVTARAPDQPPWPAGAATIPAPVRDAVAVTSYDDAAAVTTVPAGPAAGADDIAVHASVNDAVSHAHTI
jgi:hypothetical protein